ncbi:hypothetical protein EBZ57_00985 [bacterium]|nr:hypothetical protein [bacterium]
MSENIKLDDLVSNTAFPEGVQKEIVIIANTDPHELNVAILDSLNDHYASAGMGRTGESLYGVEYAARIFDVKEKLAKPMRRVAVVLGAIAMGGSMSLAIQEYATIQRVASNQSPEMARDSDPIKQDDLDTATMVFGGLGLISGLLAGNMFGKILTDEEAKRRARKIIVKNQKN